MNELNDMAKHGIYNSKADYWVHLFPLEQRIYWYRADHARTYIKIKNLSVKIGRSKDGTPTSGGYLVPKKAYFVSATEVERAFLDYWDWPNLTDREAGFAGEAIVEALIEKRVVKFPPTKVVRLNDKESQLSSKDFKIEWFKDIYVEAKCERFDSSNLFIQSYEAGHKVFQVVREGQLEIRGSEMPYPFDDA